MAKRKTAKETVTEKNGAKQIFNSEVIDEIRAELRRLQESQRGDQM